METLKLMCDKPLCVPALCENQCQQVPMRHKANPITCRVATENTTRLRRCVCFTLFENTAMHVSSSLECTYKRSNSLDHRNDK